jgi:hypothetical protein
MLHIRLLDMVLIGMRHGADFSGYDLDNDQEYITFVKDMTDMEFDNVEYFSVDFIHRLSPIMARIDEALRVKREENKVF